MENTEKVFFEDDRPQWYVALGENWVGPLTAADVYERVVSQKITWAHYVWKQGQSEWKRLCDVKTFAAAVPGAPSKSLQREVKETSVDAGRPVVKQAAKKVAEPSDEQGWYLYYNETQFGPFTKDDVGRLLSTGKITPRVHAWRTGLPNWTRLQELPNFKEAVAEFKPASGAQGEAQKKIDMRQTPRRPLVARVLMAGVNRVTEAVCRDISVGGMQVLTDNIPGGVGARIKLNVSATSIEAFVAEGVIVRLLEDQKGFSFRFEKLGDKAQRAIEDYIQSGQ